MNSILRFFHTKIFGLRVGKFPLLVAAAMTTCALFAPQSAFSQVRLGPKGPYTPRVKQPPAGKKASKPIPRPNEPERFQLSVDPAAEPQPALKYVLLPRYRDLRPGNAAPYYYRAILSLKDRPKAGMKVFYDNYDAWMSGPYSKMPKAKIRLFLSQFTGVFASLRTATHRETCDWDWRLRDLKGFDSITFLLPEIQESRSLARILILKVRLAIADRKYDEAVELLQQGYQLAIDVAKPRTLINDLVGIAIASMMNAEMRNLISSPGAPNMYWALSTLPRPLIDTTPAMKYELTLPSRIFPLLKDAEQSRRTPGEWATVLARAAQGLRGLNGQSGSGGLDGPISMQSRMMATGLALRGYSRAKRDLAEWGYDANRVDAMPVGQVVAIHQAWIYEHTSQALLKWMHLPYHQSLPGIRRAEQKLKENGFLASGPRSREVIPLVSLLLPATLQSKVAEARLEMRFAGLRALEAVRLHAAQNGNRLPKSLDEISAVPVPNNPATNKPFAYSVNGKTAILTIPSAPKQSRRSGWKLEITLRP